MTDCIDIWRVFMPARRKGSEVHKAKEALRAFCCPETGAQTVCGQSVTGVSIEVQTEKVEQPILSAERTKERWILHTLATFLWSRQRPEQ